MPIPGDLERLRGRIDDVDARLAALLEERRSWPWRSSTRGDHGPRPRRQPGAGAPGSGRVRRGRRADPRGARAGLHVRAARVAIGAAARGGRRGPGVGRASRPCQGLCRVTLVPSHSSRGASAPRGSSTGSCACRRTSPSRTARCCSTPWRRVPADVLVRRPGADVRSTAGALRTLGALEGVDELDGGRDAVPGARRRDGGRGWACRATAAETFDCGNSGTTVRFLTGALAGRATAAEAMLTGDASLSRRPMERVAAPLREMGATIETTDGRLPIRVRGRRPLRAMAHRLPVASAQVLGAISLAALSADGRTTIETPGPTRDHTERLLAWLGAPIHREGTTTTIDGPAALTARSFTVPGDLSSAAAWLVAASIHPNAEVRLRDVSLNPSRLAIVDVLREMGAEIEMEPGRRRPRAHRRPARSAAPGRLRSIVLSGARIAELIDELPLLAIAMAAATRHQRGARRRRVARQGVGPHRARGAATCAPSASTRRSCRMAGASRALAVRRPPAHRPRRTRSRSRPRATTASPSPSPWRQPPAWRRRSPSTTLPAWTSPTRASGRTSRP